MLYRVEAKFHTDRLAKFFDKLSEGTLDRQ